MGYILYLCVPSPNRKVREGQSMTGRCKACDVILSPSEMRHKNAQKEYYELCRSCLAWSFSSDEELNWSGFSKLVNLVPPEN